MEVILWMGKVYFGISGVTYWLGKFMKVDLENGKWNVNSMWVSENEYGNWTIMSWVFNTHIWGFTFTYRTSVVVGFKISW